MRGRTRSVWIEFKFPKDLERVLESNRRLIAGAGGALLVSCARMAVKVSRSTARCWAAARRARPRRTRKATCAATATPSHTVRNGMERSTPLTTVAADEHQREERVDAGTGKPWPDTHRCRFPQRSFRAVFVEHLHVPADTLDADVQGVDGFESADEDAEGEEAKRWRPR